MNATETAAFEWLQTQGYAVEEITYQYTRSPDFMTADSLGWEVKRPVGRVLNFGARQICDLRHLGTTTVLVWPLGAKEPAAVVDFAALTIPGQWEGYLLRASWQPKSDIPQSLRTPAEVDAIVARYMAQGRRRKAMELLAPSKPERQLRIA